MTFQIEFPDYPVSEMPSLPEGFEDTSWHNDACPSFTSDKHGLTVWVDYADSAQREHEGKYPRFNVAPQLDGIEISGNSLQTDDWNEVLAFIAGHAK